MKHLLIALFIAIPLNAMAQTRQAIVERYYAALNGKDYVTAAQYIRQSDLAEFKSTFGYIYKLEAQDGKRDLLDATFGKSAKLDDVLNARPEDLFARVISYVMNLSNTTVGNMQIYAPHVLGEVPESQILVHEVVCYNIQLGSRSSSKVDVISLATEGMNWKIVLPEQMKNFGTMLRQQLEKRGLR